MAKKPKPVGFVTLKRRHAKGPRKGKRKRAPIMPVVSPPQRRRAFRIHAQRKPHARRIDEALRAPLAPTAGHWERSPNRLDMERVDYGETKRKVKTKQKIKPKSKDKTRQKEVVFDVGRQKEMLKVPSKARVAAEREKAVAKRMEERRRMEKDFDRWLEKHGKQKAGNPHKKCSECGKPVVETGQIIAGKPVVRHLSKKDARRCTRLWLSKRKAKATDRLFDNIEKS